MLYQDSLHIKHFSYLVLIFLSVLIATYECSPCYGQTIYQRALKHYKDGHYKEAGLLFNEYMSHQLNVEMPLAAQLPSLEDKPLLVYSILYQAVCLERSGDIDDAALVYKILADRYEGSAVGDEAKKSLAHPKIANVIRQKIGDTVRSAQLDSLPKETWVPFQRFGQLMLVQGSINGRKAPMLFDTGAAGCLFSLDHLKMLGLDTPKGKPTASVAGVGTQKQTPAWIINADLKLGSISRRQFPVQVNENPLNYPLLGTNFFEGMEYTIDNEANVIKFKTVSTENKMRSNKMSITVDALSHYVYNVPFSEVNRAIVVTAKIEGRDCQMMIDTGTDLSLFTQSQLRGLGIMPKNTGQFVNCKGAAGYIRAPLCVYSKAEFGPIRGPLVCILSDQNNLPFPLLGQNFLKEWQLTVDHSNHLIKLIRR